MPAPLSLAGLPKLCGASSPLYLQIADGLELLIHAQGDGAVGRLLPSETDCVRHFGVNRLTVRQAMSLLSSKGLIVRHRGRGTFVSNLPLDHDIGRAFEDEMRTGGRNAASRLLEWKRMPVSAELAKIFAPGTSDQMYRLRRLRMIDGKPVGLEERYMPADLGDRISESDLERHSPFALLRKLTGERHVQMRFVVNDARADAALARLLRVPRGTPLLVRRNTCYFQGDRALLHGTVTFVFRNYQFRFNATMDLPST
jgi:GntR family transcriptional regulator